MPERCRVGVARDRGTRRLFAAGRVIHDLPGTFRHHHHRQHGSRARARHQSGDAGGAARSGDVGRGVGHGLRSARAAHRGASHHADVREHAPHGGAGFAPSRRTARRNRGRRASWFALEGNPLRCRAASQGRPAQGRWWRRLRSSWASTSATSSWSASSARRVRSRRFCNASAAPITRSSGVPKGRIFPSSRDEMVDCVALLDSVRRGELDRLHIPEHPLDVLSQQIVAEVAAREYGEDELFDADAPRVSVSQSRAQGFRCGGAHAGGWHQHEARTARHLSSSRCRQQGAAATQGRTPHGHHLRRRDSGQCRLPGDPRARGNFRRHPQRGFRHRKPRRRYLPARQYFLSRAARGGRPGAGRRRQGTAAQHSVLAGRGAGAHRRAFDVGVAAARRNRRAAARGHERVHRARHRHGGGAIPPAARRPRSSWWSTWPAPGRARQTTHAAIRWCSSGSSTSPAACSSSSTRRIGARINRAFGLALRKKFCRTFNFELQAAATEDAIVLSLGETHSFELASVARFLNSKTVEDTLIQAMLDSPMFTARWRWNASISLAIRRASGGKRTPPNIQRMAAEDLIAVVFPDQIACAENLTGPREIPDHPLVKQTLAGLPARGHGPRRPEVAAARARRRRYQGGREGSADAVAAGREKSSAQDPTPSSTTRRSKSAVPMP